MIGPLPQYRGCHGEDLFRMPTTADSADDQLPGTQSAATRFVRR